MLLTLVIFFLPAAWIPLGEKGRRLSVPVCKIDPHILERCNFRGNLQPPFYRVMGIKKAQPLSSGRYNWCPPQDPFESILRCKDTTTFANKQKKTLTIIKSVNFRAKYILFYVMAELLSAKNIDFNTPFVFFRIFAA